MSAAQIVTLSCFRFRGAAAKCWAFSQMQFARRPLRDTPGIGFHKLFGTGTRLSFHPYPNFAVYAILAVWDSLDAAREELPRGVFARYQERAREHATLYLQPVRSSGRWDRGEPFRTAGDGGALPRPLAVLTRATLKKRHLRPFWRSVPDISAMLDDRPGLLFKLGMGEIPLLHQVTFSVWTDDASMKAFAYRSGAHRDAIRAVRRYGWFYEELFARFAVLDCEGRWEGRPLALLSSVDETADAA